MPPRIDRIVQLISKKPKESHFVLQGNGLDDIKTVTIADAGGYSFHAKTVKADINSPTQQVISVKASKKAESQDDGEGQKEDRESTDEITVVVTNTTGQSDSEPTQVVITDEELPT